MERIIDRYIKDELNKTGMLNSNQHASQEGKSTETALHDLVSQIEDTFGKKEYAICTFMDIAGAFDNISLEALNTHIEHCGLNKHIVKWINYMLAHKTITYTHQNHRTTVKATKGTPQGGVISPTLWIMVMNSLLKRLKENGIKTVGYAYDLVIICRGKYLSVLSDSTQSGIRIVEKWCDETGLSVNPDKSEIVIFTKNRLMNGYRNPKIFGKEIMNTNQTKYLGIILDSKLNWSKHIDYRLNKCLKIFWCCRSAIGKTWGLTPKNILWIFDTIVKPMLAYGSFIWWYGITTEYAKNKLNHLRRMACIAIAGAMRTTPQAALEALLNTRMAVGN